MGKCAVAQLAAEAGYTRSYSDVFRFFRQFRERTGTTPARYRAARR